MKQLLLLKGLPASGKSTYAKRLVDENPGQYKRINKDDIRAMLDNSKWSKDNERFVLKVRDSLILAALEEGKHVIVDDTNLAPKHEGHIRQLIKGLAEFRVVEFPVDPEECIERDLKRPNSVGPKVIWDMYNQFLKPKPLVYTPKTGLPLAIICDIDGTLAHHGDRSPYDWARVGEDTIDGTIRMILDHYDSGYPILLVSGRDEVCRKETEEWLLKHSVPYEELFMRPQGNNEDDRLIKQRIYETDIKDKYNVLFVLDDRDKVVKMWRDLGLKCLQVDYGNF